MLLFATILILQGNLRHAGFQEILSARQSRHEIDDRADECRVAGRQPVVDNERLVTFGCRQGGVDHPLRCQCCDAADLGLAIPPHPLGGREDIKWRVLGPPARPWTLLPACIDSHPLVSWRQVMDPCVPRPLHGRSVLREIAIAGGHRRPAILALDRRDGTLELEILARSDAIVEVMVALGEPSLTLGGLAKDGIRDI